MKRTLLVFVVCAIAAALGLIAQAQQPTRSQVGIFLDTESSGSLRADSAVARTRNVVLRSDAFDLTGEILPEQRTDQRLTLNLFPDANFTAVLSQVKIKSESSFMWLGTVENRPDSAVTLVKENEVLIGDVRIGSELYEVRYAGDGVHRVQQVDITRLPPELPPIPVEIDPAAVKAAKDLFPEYDDGSVVDVLVVYTPASRAAEGGTSAMNALIDLAVQHANTAYQNSQVRQRLRLVYRAEVNYTQSNDISVDLQRLTNPSDGHMDTVHSLRDSFRADMVTLIAEPTNACGVAWLMRAVSGLFENRAFNVTGRTCAARIFTLAHELGHNMGLAHDIANSSSSGAYSYSYGYQDPGQFRTVMAYECSFSPCPRVRHFSNPQVNYNGRPTGVADQAENARTLNNTAVTVSNFRSQASTPTPTCTTSVLPSNQTVSGILSTSDCPAPARPGARADLYTFSGTAGQRITLDMNSTQFDTFLILDGPNNAVVAYNDDCATANTLDSCLTVTLPSTGTYRVEATSFGANATGSYTLRLTTQGNCPTVDLIPNSSVNGVLSTSDCRATFRQGTYADFYTFAGNAGQRVTLTMTSRQLDTYLFLVGPNGNLVSQNDDCTTLTLDSCLTVTLPSTGTYRVEATSFRANATGAYVLTMTTTASQCQVTPMVTGTPMQGSITSTDCASQYRSGHRADRYSFIGDPGQRITLDMNSAQLDTYLFLIGPNGNIVAQNDDCESASVFTLDSCINVTLPNRGTYLVEATTYSSWATGVYSIRLMGLSQSPSVSIDSPTEGANVAGVTSVAGWALHNAASTGTGVDMVHLYLDGFAGQGRPIAAAAYGLDRPDLASVFGARYRYAGFGYNWDTSAIPPGPHTLFVYVHSIVTSWSVYTRQITVLPAPPPAPVLASIDSPVPEAQFFRGETIPIGGWAIHQSAPSGTGVDDVHLYLDGLAGGGGIPIAAATYGLDRPDVANAFGNQRFRLSGFLFFWNSSSVSPGRHTLYVYVHSTLTGWTFFTRSFTVQ